MMYWSVFSKGLMIKSAAFVIQRDAVSAGSVQPGEDSRGFYECVKIPSGGNKGDRARLFSVVPHGRTRGIGHTLKYKRLHLHVRKHLFFLKVIRCWHRLLTGVMWSPSLEILKPHLDGVLSSLLWLTLLEQGLACAHQLQLFHAVGSCLNRMRHIHIINWVPFVIMMSVVCFMHHHSIKKKIWSTDLR